MLMRLTYYSKNRLATPGAPMLGDINAIVRASRRNNARVGVTGVLMIDPLWLLQVLEGERGAVSATLARIVADRRHSDVVIMEAEPVDDRMFRNWWMGLAALRTDESALYTRLGLPAQLAPDKMTASQVGLLALELGSHAISGNSRTDAA